MEAMDLQATDLTALNNLYNLIGVLQGMVLNIELISTGTIGKVLTIANANLYQIAAVEYGDATQWTTIATANGLVDPVIEPTITAFYLGGPPATTITLTGIPLSPQTITIVVSGFTYTYNVSYTDTLITICANIAKLINNGHNNVTSVNNVIIFPGLSVSNVIIIERVINLVIPQQIGLPSGGILSNK